MTSTIKSLSENISILNSNSFHIGDMYRDRFQLIDITWIVVHKQFLDNGKVRIFFKPSYMWIRGFYNHAHRDYYKYSVSATRKYLRTTFKVQISPALKKIVSQTPIKCVSEKTGKSYAGIYDLFFIPSAKQLGFQYDGADDKEETWEYYKDSNHIELMKSYNSFVDCPYYLRATVGKDGLLHETYVGSDGKLNIKNDSYKEFSSIRGFLPCFSIIVDQ